MGVVRFTGKPGVSREGMEGGGTLPLEHLWTHVWELPPPPPEAWSCKQNCAWEPEARLQTGVHPCATFGGP